MKKTLELPTPLNTPVKLAGNPSGNPRYSVCISDSKGNNVVLADPKATRATLLLMNQHAVIGGSACHWGGSSAFVEIMSAVHGLMFRRNPWSESFNFVNDAGHTENGIYALQANYDFARLNFTDLRTFRSISGRLTGHGEALENPQGVMISNGPLGSGLPQAQGLALADKITGNSRITLCTISDGACMEGEAKEALAAIPGLAHRGRLNPFVLIISDNNTKLSGRIDEDAFSMEPSFSSLESLGWKKFFLKDGHNLQEVYCCLEKALEEVQKNPAVPVVVHVRTIKGFGVQETQRDSAGGHGYPLKPRDEKLSSFLHEIYDGKIPSFFSRWRDEILNSRPFSVVKRDDCEKVQKGFGRAMNEMADKYPLFSISADLQGSTGVKGFHNKYPGYWVDVGVSEANMISTAIGLSKQGFIPVVDTFSQFGITKGNLPLIMAGLSNAPLIALFSHTGFQDAADGASHQATTYFAATCALPQTRVVCCACSEEAFFYMKQAVDYMAQMKKKGEICESTIFFMGREDHPKSFGMEEYTWNHPQILRDGEDASLVVCGPMVEQGMNIASILDKEGISLSVINHPFVNNPNIPIFANHIQKTKGRLITMEDHQITGGMGAQLIHRLCQEGIEFKSQSLGIKGRFGRSAYMAAHLYDLHELNLPGVCRALNSLDVKIPSSLL